MDDHHGRILSWLVEVDEKLPDDAIYIAKQIVSSHFLVHAAVPWKWEKARSESARRRSIVRHYPLFRPMDVLVHKMDDDWAHVYRLTDILKRVISQLVKVGEEG